MNKQNPKALLLLLALILFGCNPRTYQQIKGPVKTAAQYSRSTEKTDVTLRLNDTSDFMLRTCNWYNKHGHLTMHVMYDWRLKDTFTYKTVYQPFKMTQTAYHGTGNEAIFKDVITKTAPRKYKIKSYYPDGKYRGTSHIVIDRHNRLIKNEEKYSTATKQLPDEQKQYNTAQEVHNVTTIYEYNNDGKTLTTIDRYERAGKQHADTTILKTDLFQQDRYGNPIMKTRYPTGGAPVTELYQYTYYNK